MALTRTHSAHMEVTDDAPGPVPNAFAVAGAKRAASSLVRAHREKEGPGGFPIEFLSFKFGCYCDTASGKRGLDKASLAKLLKDVGIMDTLESRQGWGSDKVEKFVELQFTNADADANGVVDLREFGTYYASLVDYCKALGIASSEMEAAASKGKAAAKKIEEAADNTQTVAFKTRYGVVDCKLASLNREIKEAWEKEKKTPVVLCSDATANLFFLDEDEGEYAQNVVPLDAKRMVYDCSVLKQRSEDVLELARRQTFLALDSGATLLVHCSNSTPDFTTTLCAEGVFPKEVFKAGWLEEKRDGYTAHYTDLIKQSCDFDQHLRPDFSAFKSTPGYRVLLTSSLKVAELDMLAANLPVPADCFKFIRVKA